MSKYEVIQFLINEISIENNKQAIYNKALTEAKEIEKTDNKFNAWCYLDYNNIKPTNNAKIKEYLKLIRRLSLEIEKEMDTY